MGTDARFMEVRTAQAIDTVACLAGVIWREHYVPITGSAQVEYMLLHFQSASAIAGQILGGMRYFLIKEADLPMGYLSVQYQPQTQELFLSKLYLLKEKRGLGYGRAALDFVRSLAEQAGARAITLTVNKRNTPALQAYLRYGFENAGPVVKDIGGGFFMDDYRMVIKL
jgi:diamine N-acetyltransferase